MSKQQFPQIMRLFGPVGKSLGNKIAVDLCESGKFCDLVQELACGDIEPREFAYAVQIMMETAELSFTETPDYVEMEA